MGTLAMRGGLVVVVLALVGMVLANDGTDEKKVNDQEALTGTVLGAESETVVRILAEEAKVKATTDKLAQTEAHIALLKPEKVSMEAAIEKLRPPYMRTYQPVINLGNDLLRQKVTKQSLEVDRDMLQDTTPDLEASTIKAETDLKVLQHRLAALKFELSSLNAPDASIKPLFSVKESKKEAANTQLFDRTTDRRSHTADSESQLS